MSEVGEDAFQFKVTQDNSALFFTGPFRAAAKPSTIAEQGLFHGFLRYQNVHAAVADYMSDRVAKGQPDLSYEDAIVHVLKTNKHLRPGAKTEVSGDASQGTPTGASHGASNGAPDTPSNDTTGSSSSGSNATASETGDPGGEAMAIRYLISSQESENNASAKNLRYRHIQNPCYSYHPLSSLLLG